MRFNTQVLSLYLVGVVVSQAGSLAQIIRIEAESGTLNGFSVRQAELFSGGAATRAEVATPTATYTFRGWDGPYDVSVAYCDEDDGNSSYQLSASSVGTFASWNGDLPSGSTNCNGAALKVREVATAVELERGETISFGCQRDPGEPCRVDYFDFAYVGPMPPVGQRAFPGAMGFGARTSGARGLGAQVCVVINLADSGPGSFRACAERARATYITFAVSGYINLADEVDIMENKTLECATAPGDGVVFRGSRFQVLRGNVILRGCRVWVGNGPAGQPLAKRDAIAVSNLRAIEDPVNTVKNVIIANNSMLFGVRRSGNASYPVANVTFQHNLVGWGLSFPLASRGMHIYEDTTTVSMVENYFAMNDVANPQVSERSEHIEIVNNLVYCHKRHAVSLVDEVVTTHVVGNRFRGRFNDASEGCDADYGDNRLIKLRESSVAYVRDNTTDDGSPATIYADATSEVAAEPLFTSSVVPASSDDVEERVFAEAGPPRLISFEIDAFEHYVNGTGKIIESVGDLGGWPTLVDGTKPPDGDGDGMPNWWEMAHCGGQCAPTSDRDGDGYENIEEWFHSFYRPRAPVALDVDASPLSSDGNGVFESGEQVEVAPTWRNDGRSARVLDGVASSFTGPAGATYTVLTDAASYGTLQSGETASCLGTGLCYEMALNDPAERPATHWDARFKEGLSEGSTQTWALHIGESFTDVPRSSPFYRSVETMLHHRVTSGCTDTAYCLTSPVSRGQLPMFVLKAAEGLGYLPPACVESEEVFGDVPASDPRCRWIEELANRGVVAGCGAGNYCPSAPVTRAQMAVFLLKSLEGGRYAPPMCGGTFADVACPSTFANWIEELYNRGITSGCSSTPRKYCPSALVSRGQTAVLVSKALGLTLYGP